MTKLWKIFTVVQSVLMLLLNSVEQRYTNELSRLDMICKKNLSIGKNGIFKLWKQKQNKNYCWFLTKTKVLTKN